MFIGLTYFKTTYRYGMISVDKVVIFNFKEKKNKKEKENI